MLQLVLTILIYLIIVIPVGRYLYHIAAGKHTFADPVFDRVDGVIYKIGGVHPAQGMNWKQYALALVGTNAVMVAMGYLVLRIQSIPLFNPNGIGAMEPTLSFNTIISFMTNTNLQHYSGESGLSYLSQMLVIIFMMFVSAATGYAACVAFIRGLAGKSRDNVGNFFVDLIRITTRILLPFSIVGGLLLVWRGVPQNLDSNVVVKTLEGTFQTIAMGPIAALEIIKHLGTNGGGFLGANSSTPLENPTMLSDLIELYSMMLLPGACVITFGKMVGDSRRERLQDTVPDHVLPDYREGFTAKIFGREMKLTALCIIIHPLLILAFSALAVGTEAGRAGITNPGFHFPGLFGDADPSLRTYNLVVSIILLITVLFANFAESVAEGRGKAQAASLKKAQIVSSSELKKGDVVMVVAGEVIPGDGEVMEGIASVDESAITGESAPVVRESGGDFCSVTGGTTGVSDWLKIRITSDPGNSFLDRMIALVEGASRKKTPNEIALNTLLVSLTIIFLIVIVTLYPIGIYSGVQLPVSTLIALMVCLIPTAIGGLLSAIGIAGMDRVTRFNVIVMSGKAVEACGDVDTMILDKTGAITFGNRLAADFFPVEGASRMDLIRCAALTSLYDETPESKSTLELARRLGDHSQETAGSTFLEFTAQTRMSGVDLPDGTHVRKGASDAIEQYVKEQGGKVPADLHAHVEKVSSLGGTPLVVCENNKVLGVIYLKDTVKPGMAEWFARLRAIGIKTIKCTGDTPLTAATIAKEAGVDGFIAECKPEDKISVIKKEQTEGKIVAMTGDGTNDASALAQANVGLAMNSGTTAAKEAANMVDLDSDPTKILEVVEIGKQLLITRGSLTTFSIANDIAKYFATIPAMFMAAVPQLSVLNIMHLSVECSAILSALIFNAIIIPCRIPLAMKGVKYRPMSSGKMLARNMMIYGLGGVITPFVGIKIIDIIIAPVLLGMGV